MFSLSVAAVPVVAITVQVVVLGRIYLLAVFFCLLVHKPLSLVLVERQLQE
jgi:hypothetical protein